MATGKPRPRSRMTAPRQRPCPAAPLPRRPRRTLWQRPPPGRELLAADLRRSGCRPPHEVRDAQPMVEEAPLLERADEFGREARAVKCLPEPVARAGEVMSHGARIEARVDPHEQDVQ